MPDISKWLEMLVGPQLAGTMPKAPLPPGTVAPGGEVLPNRLPPEMAGGTPPGEMPTPDLPNKLPGPMSLDPASAPLPGLGGPPVPEDIGVLNDPAANAPLTTPGVPLNAAMGIEGPDPTRVENTGSLVPDQVPVDVPVANLAPIAPAPIAPVPPAVAAPLAKRKQRGRPLSKVNIAGAASGPPRAPAAPPPAPRSAPGLTTQSMLGPTNIDVLRQLQQQRSIPWGAGGVPLGRK